jgi:hypothetical protein
MMKISGFVLTLVLVLAGATTASAQIGIIKGRVLLRQPDGKTSPVAGAVVDIFSLETDFKMETKTKEGGTFLYVGMESSAPYLISVSAQGARPAVALRIRALDTHSEDLILEAGDGKRLTREEAFAAAGSELPALLKMKMGDSSMRKRERGPISPQFYDAAIKYYDEGFALAPNYRPLLERRAFAYEQRGLERLNAALKITDDALRQVELARSHQDLLVALEGAALSLQLLKAEQVPVDEEARNRLWSQRTWPLSLRATALGAIARWFDRSKAEEAFDAYWEQASLEPGELAEGVRAYAMRLLIELSTFEMLFTKCQKILAADQDNKHALFWSSKAIYESRDRKRFPLALERLQRLVRLTADGDLYRSEALQLIRLMQP